MSMRTTTISAQEIEAKDATVNAIEAAAESIEQLREKLKARGDGDRAAKLRTAISRVEEAARLVEDLFR